jgi:2-polyprenyl-3-methyl-5-hydroxy-6-metoxy-1,4-benzoquinol methylase
MQGVEYDSVQIHQQKLPEIERYIDDHLHEDLADKEVHYQNYLRILAPYRAIDSSTSVLEIGTGTGWFPLLCEAHGISCKGLEISPQLIEYALEMGRRHGLNPDIELGNVEDSDLGRELYDVVIASSVFEHIEYWPKALERVYDAMRPGGALFFESSNKYCPVSAEYNFPLYGWLPDQVRYWLRRKLEGEDVMKLGIDFNQFTHPQLRREFKRIGFSKIYDRVDLADPPSIQSPLRRRVASAAKASRMVRFPVLMFSDVTRFVCVK